MSWVLRSRHRVREHTQLETGWKPRKPGRRKLNVAMLSLNFLRPSFSFFTVFQRHRVRLGQTQIDRGTATARRVRLASAPAHHAAADRTEVEREGLAERDRTVPPAYFGLPPISIDLPWDREVR